MSKPTMWFPSCISTEAGYKLEILEGEEEIYHPCYENQGANQLIYALVFAYRDSWLSNAAAQILIEELHNDR